MLTREKFKAFYARFFHLSPLEYKSIDEIVKNPPIYDLYVTGSDQVWNYTALNNDPVMYCSFAPKGSRIISFGASFTNKSLPQQYHKEIQRRLERYDKIGVIHYIIINICDSISTDLFRRRQLTGVGK